MRLTQLTPQGVGGVALVRLTGPGSKEALARCFVARKGLPPAGEMALGELRDREGQTVDEVLLVRADEDAFELGCHGGPGVVRAVLAALRALGARPERAALAQADDRIGAEAREALRLAPTELGCRVLLAQGNGALANEAQAIAALASHDPVAASARLARLQARARLGRALIDPPTVALVGLPNAGKSSLLNALLGRERVLVSAAPGTTRDAVDALVELDGVPARLIDTAGRREAGDAIESEGIARAAAEARRADLRLVVLDGSALGDDALALAEEASEPKLLALNKSDLARDARLEGALSVSALTGDGLPALRAALRAALVGDVADEGPTPFTPRQAGLLAGAGRALERGDADRAAWCLAALAGG